MWCCQGAHNFSLGAVYLQEKLRSSQRLSISSLVSVKLANEGRLLSGDRNPGPSHFQPKPKVGDWDDDIKLDGYRDFVKAISYSPTTFLPTKPIHVEFDPSMPINASDHVFSPLPTTVPGRSGGIGLDEDEQRKLTPAKVCPAGRSMARSKKSKARKVHVLSGSTSTTSMSPLSDLLVPVPLMPPVQVQATRRKPPMVPQHRRQQDDSVQPSSSLPPSVPASTSSVPQSPKDKDKDSTSPTTSTPTPAPFFRPSGRSRVNSKVRPKPSTTDPFPTPFKGLRRLIGITKEPDKGKQREQDKQVEDLSSSWCLVGSRATDRDRMGAENAYGGEPAMETGGKWRAGSYPLDPFDAVLLDQSVFTLLYC